MPHRFGMISGVFFGVAFGIGGSGLRCWQARGPHRHHLVYQLCGFLPALGLLAVFTEDAEARTLTGMGGVATPSFEQLCPVPRCFCQHIVRMYGGSHFSVSQLHRLARCKQAKAS